MNSRKKRRDAIRARKTVDKTFKTKPKAEEYIRKHFSK